MNEPIEKSVYHYLTHLLCWLESNGWAGWDPYDIWDNRIGMWIMKRANFPQRVACSLSSRLEKLFPVPLRKLLSVVPQINPKAMGLFAAGFLQLEASEGNPRLINGKAGYLPCFRWLEEQKVNRFGGCGWGYPFDWQSRILIPRNTPTVVNSAVIGDAYWLWYKLHGDEKALARCEDICEFILHGLNRSARGKDGSFCFSYTPLDNFQVHNANLFGAEFLIRIGMETGREDWVETGLSAGRFSLSEIRKDGTLNYWSNEQAKGLQQDTYHSGFEIRAFANIARLTGDEKFQNAAKRYFATWLKDFFSKQGVPCFVRGQYDVIEVHSCAESLLCAARMFDGGNFSQELFLKHVQHVIDTAVKSLWVQNGADKGYFAWRNGTHFGVNLKIKIPMIRWGQAWMFNALSTVLNCVRS